MSSLAGWVWSKGPHGNHSEIENTLEGFDFSCFEENQGMVTLLQTHQWQVITSRFFHSS